MRTLVIHPKDKTTDFLSFVYKNKRVSWEIVTDQISKSKLKTLIKESDRVVFMGHGTEDGLINANRNGLIIDSSLVYLLRDKIGAYIWCNADQFVKKYGLQGFYTGMIISEFDEAQYYCNVPFTNQQIEFSNELFSSCLFTAFSFGLDSPKFLQVIKGIYDNGDTTEFNPIVEFNKQNIYSTFQ